MGQPAESEGTRVDPRTTEGLTLVVQYAYGLLRNGQISEAFPLLIRAVSAHEAENPPVTQVRFLAHRLLAQCARQVRRFDDARTHYMFAFHLAEQLPDLDLASAALEGMALVERHDKNPRGAAELFERSLEYARGAERQRRDGPAELRPTTARAG